MLESKRLPALTAEDSLQKYLKQVNAIPSLTKEEEFLLAKNYLEQDDLKAAHRLVMSHLKLVAKIAMQYKNYGLPISELVSECNIGLMQAVKKYDPQLGNRLSTYAMWWIKASIQEYVLKSWSLVKIGTTAAQKKIFFSLSKIKNKITSTQGRSVSSSDFGDIAEELGVSTKEVEEMNLRLSGPDISLNYPANKDDSNAEIIDFIPEDNPSHELTLMHKQDIANKRTVLLEALNILNDREAKILKKRKLSDNPATLDLLSHEYKISKERIRQIESKAFEKVQNYILSRISIDDQIKQLPSSV